jgi:hypothetical protein
LLIEPRHLPRALDHGGHLGSSTSNWPTSDYIEDGQYKDG